MTLKLTFLDLRKSPRKLMDALARRESVTLSRRGKVIGRVSPVESGKRPAVAEHPAFGMWARHPGMKDPAKTVRRMRQPRHGAV